MSIERQVRLWTALIVAAYVVMHLLNHAVGLVSLEAMEATRRVMRLLWGNPVVNPILLLAFLTHFLLALVALYRRATTGRARGCTREPARRIPRACR